ncbi:hypothetical protein FPQ18DRAFT_302723 [Pyronema domesticum]|nr:hypothetical protein FPQ18DRAFT_302723 [Pyronema domesticum]
MGTRVVRGYGAVLQSALSTGTDRSGGTGGVGGVGTRVVLLRREGVVRDDYEGHMGIQGLLGVSKQGGGGREYLGGTQALLSTQGMLGTPDTQGTQGLTSSQKARRLRKVECLREFRLVKWEGREDEEGVLRWFGVLKDGAWRDVPAEETVEELLEEEGEWGGLTKEQREFGDFWPVELDTMVEEGMFLEDDGGVGGEGYVVPGKAVEGGVEEDEVEGSKEIGKFGRTVTETVEEEEVEVPKENEQREDQSKVEDAYFSDSSLTPPPETPKTAEEEQIAEEIVTTEEHQPIEETGAVEVNRSSSLTPVPEDPMEAPERSSSLTPLEETPDPAANQPLLPIEPAYEYQPEEATYPEAAPEEELPEYSEYPTQHQLKHPPQQHYELAEAAEEPPYSPRAPSVSPISTPLTTNPTPRATPPPPEDPPEIPFIASQILSGPALRDALQQARESTQRRMAASRIPPNYSLPAEADPSIAPALAEEELSTQDTLPHLSQHNLHHLNESFQSTASNTTSDHPVLSQPPPSSPRPEATGSVAIDDDEESAESTGETEVGDGGGGDSG